MQVKKFTLWVFAFYTIISNVYYIYLAIVLHIGLPFQSTIKTIEMIIYIESNINLIREQNTN